jgi:hypothetical protein
MIGLAKQIQTLKLTPVQKRNRTQWAAQFLAAAELVRRGYTVAFTMGNHTPNADLMVGTRSHQQFWVDVKGTSGRDWPISPKTYHINLFYILVRVASPEKPPDRFFILTQQETNDLVRDYHETHEGHSGKVSGFDLRDAERVRAEDRWDKFPL